jgi:hypothetical protein
MDLLAPWLASLTADSAAPTNGLPAETSFDVAPVADGNWWGRLLVVNLPGQADILGLFSDAAFFSENVPISGALRAPIYASLYGGMGLLEGWLDMSGDLPGGVLMWIKQAGVSSLGSEGFTNTTWATLASQ